MQPRRVRPVDAVLALPPPEAGLGLGTLRFQLRVDLGDAFTATAELREECEVCLKA